MNLPKYKVLLIGMLVFVTSLSAETSAPDEMKDRITILEARLAELEARLLEAEGLKVQQSSDAETRIKELEVRLSEAEKRAKMSEQTAIRSALRAKEAMKDDAANEFPKTSIYDQSLWTHEKQWSEVEPGMSIEKVIELLGPPPRSLDSLKPRVDEVFFYQTNFQQSPGSLYGKISFRKGKVLSVEKPDFGQTVSELN